MAYLDEISIAVSPYVARSNKAIDFYENHYKYNSEKNNGLFLAVGNGPIDGWENSNPDLPSLETFDVENIQLFRYFSNMYFVKSDNDGKINVGNLRWSKLMINNMEEDKNKKYNEILNTGCRWIYVEFQIPKEESINGKIRQVGVYSHLKLKNPPEKIDRNKSYKPQEFETLSSGKRRYDGILELVQNKIAYSKGNSKEIYAYVLEF